MPFGNNHYYYETIRKTVLQFLNIFSDIKIARYDNDTGNILKYIKLPVSFSPKSKAWF